MSQKQSHIDQRLLQDCHYLGDLGSGALLLHRNAAIHWFILVPHTEVQDVLDLSAERRDAVLQDCAVVSAYIKRQLGYDKVNFAGLGNVVPQMHLHIIGRRVGDGCWPQPVWGNLPDGGGYSQEVLMALLASLREEIGLADAAPGCAT